MVCGGGAPVTGGVKEGPAGVGGAGMFRVGDTGGAVVVAVVVVVVVVVLEGALLLLPPHAAVNMLVARIATVTATPATRRANRCDVIASSPVRRSGEPGLVVSWTLHNAPHSAQKLWQVLATSRTSPSYC